MERNERYDKKETVESIDGEVGYLIVRVTTAGGAIPLEDALVSIRGEAPSDSGVIFTLKTDRDGRTPKIALKTPRKSLSESKNDLRPYALYNVDVMKKGYVPVYFHSVPIFPDVLSIQPATLAPLPEPDPENTYPIRQDLLTDPEVIDESYEGDENASAEETDI